MGGNSGNDTVYDDDYRGLDEISGTIYLDLFNNTSVEGALKSWDVPDGATRIDKLSKSKDSVSVERLLCVDGWEKTTVDAGGKKKPEGLMSLWILKFIFNSSYKDRVRLSHFRAELYFKDKDQKRKDDPEVQAWAPWRKMEVGNFSKGQEKITITTEASIQGGYQGNQASFKRSKAHEISFDRIIFDRAQSGLRWNLGGRPSGVYWQIERDPVDTHNNGAGLSAEIWAAALVSRTTNEPYSVEFGFTVNSGTIQDFYQDRVKTVFRKPDAPGGNISRFTIIPNPGNFRNWNNPEGKEIESTGNIDPENLGKLRDPQLTTPLKVSWTEEFQQMLEVK
ncbi:hypothetical protein B0O99DRAFT_727198 [Bisporella sp. PMI_857]|nr:hypothetical protein B0O99DRAFT_727198 [Bisporella sp. PMI_857]